MRYAPIVLSLLLGSTPPALAQLTITFGSPEVSIGIDLPVYPTLQRVPGYPVYYAPGLDTNYFFYDGLYWVYERDSWYASSWYNGPWSTVDRFDVPVYLLRVPVRYYRHAPAYFRGWRADAPPRWGDHWGPSWEQRRSGWDRWNRSSAPAPAPLPTFQRQYSGDRYPQHSQQAVIQGRNYRYQPRDTVARQHYQQQREWARQPQERGYEPRRDQRGEPQREQREQRAAEREQRAAEREQRAAERDQREQRATQREQREQRAAQQQQQAQEQAQQRVQREAQQQQRQAQEQAQQRVQREQREAQQQQQKQAQEQAEQRVQREQREQREAQQQKQAQERAQQQQQGRRAPQESGG